MLHTFYQSIHKTAFEILVHTKLVSYNIQGSARGLSPLPFMAAVKAVSSYILFSYLFCWWSISDKSVVCIPRPFNNRPPGSGSCFISTISRMHGVPSDKIDIDFRADKYFFLMICFSCSFFPLCLYILLSSPSLVSVLMSRCIIVRCITQRTPTDITRGLIAHYHNAPLLPLLF